MDIDMQSYRTLFIFLLFTFSSLFAYDSNFTTPPPHFEIGELSLKELIGQVAPPKHTPEPDTGTRYFFGQWFTGPLLMPAPTTASPQHPCFESGVTVIDGYGSYNNNWKIEAITPKTWSINYLEYWQFGITGHLGCEIIASLQSNYKKHISSTQFLDTIFRLGYQITQDKYTKGSWLPDIRIIFQEQFPTGRYQKLNPNKNNLDQSGGGAFVSGLWIATLKGFKWPTDHAFNLGGAIGYFLQSSVKVKGINSYGGNHFTEGRVYPGNSLSIFFSGEFEITNHLGIAFDSNYIQTFSGRFKGNQGTGNPVNLPQSVSFQLALPEIEVIISKQAGFIFGPWWTFSGQNSPAFVSFFVDFLYIF